MVEEGVKLKSDRIRFAASYKDDGGWVGYTERPFEALQQAREIYGGDQRIFVAKMERVLLTDIAPKAETLLGDMRERLVAEHGEGVDEVFDDPRVLDQVPALASAIHEAVHIWESTLGFDLGVYRKLMVRSYRTNEHIKPRDF